MSNPAFAATAALTLALGIGGGTRAQAQAEGNDALSFEVASVKPSSGCPPSCGLIRPSNGSQGYHAEGASLRSLMTVAYTVTERQISGGPSWMNTEGFDIEAKAERPHTTDELHTMLQHLLEERFHLKLRRETNRCGPW
jgi:uncharacterized protein (TIGR03435 family)